MAAVIPKQEGNKKPGNRGVLKRTRQPDHDHLGPCCPGRGGGESAHRAGRSELLTLCSAGSPAPREVGRG